MNLGAALIDMHAKCGNIEAADRIRIGLLRLESGQAGCHVLLSNVYAAAGKWNEALKIRNITKEKGIRNRNIIKEKGIRKQSGFSNV
uniref:Uncharacterized protein n=1 Tax=Nymphaea colorata TaxID=210225 RepID=A0A5K1G4D2_9MAGN